jgi:hypothetical protein
MPSYRMGGPKDAIRPFVPGSGVTQVEFQIVEALDHIARALSAIDTNLERLTEFVISQQSKPAEQQKDS